MFMWLRRHKQNMIGNNSLLNSPKSVLQFMPVMSCQWGQTGSLLTGHYARLSPLTRYHATSHPCLSPMTPHHTLVCPHWQYITLPISVRYQVLTVMVINLTMKPDYKQMYKQYLACLHIVDCDKHDICHCDPYSGDIIRIEHWHFVM